MVDTYGLHRWPKPRPSWLWSSTCSSGFGRLRSVLFGPCSWPSGVTHHVARFDCPGGPAGTQPAEEPAAGQGPLGCGLGTVPALGRVLWAGAPSAGDRRAAPVHELGVLGLWGAGVDDLVGADPRLSPLRADPGPGPERGA